MATGNKLEVQIGADITDFQKKIKEVEFDVKELSKAKLEKIKLGLDTREITSQIKDAKASLNSLKTAVRDTGAQVGGQFTKQVGNGNNALMQFSRIAQDAPYGIIGIGNNITATAESFGYLKQQTGSTSGALKAMASSLMGTGGILLGVSLLTTGLTLLSQSGLSVGDIIDKVTGKFNKFSAEMQKVNEEAAKSSGKEIANLNALISVAQDKNISDKKRINAVKELQSIFPSYFGNLSQEKILNGDLTKITDGLTEAILARARASALSGKLGELAAQRLVLEEKREKSILDIEKARKAASKDRSIYNVKDIFSLKAATDAYKETTKAINELDIQSKKYSERLNKDTATSAPLLGGGGKATETIIKRANVELVTNLEAIDPSKLQTEYKKELTLIEDSLGKATIQPIDLKIPVQPIFDSLGYDESERAWFANFMLKVQELNNQVNELIDNSIGSALSNVGSSIGTALAEGTSVVSALGSSLLQALGGFLGELGKKMIAYGLLLAGFGAAQKAFESGDATVKIGAGIAMVALGIALTAAGGAVSSLGAKGSSGKTSTSTGQGANNSSTTSGSSGGWSSSANGTVVFEIAGTSLIGVLNNTTERNLRIGGR